MVPFYRQPTLLEEMDRLARDMWDSWRPFTIDQAFAPHTDMYEEDGQFIVKTEIPGIDKDDLKVTLDGDKLTISAEKNGEVKEDATHHVQERYYGRYFRSVTLPYPVKEDEVSATLENGVLELKLPKAEEVKPKQIEIKAQLPESEPAKKPRKPRKKKE